MKDRKQKPDRGNSVPRGGAGDKSASISLKQIPLFRRFLFLGITLFVIPLALWGVLELGLRVIGFGYQTGFFIPAQNGRAGDYMENQSFGWSFFPKRLARAPEPLLLAKQKAEGVCRIFVMGESAALGDPEPAYGLSRMLSVLLSSQFPGKRFEVVPVAMTAINSHTIRRIAQDCAPFQGDFWVIYMGNNEVVGPYGAGSAFGSSMPGLSAIRVSLALKRTRVGQSIDWLAQRFASGSHQATEWEGMKTMAGQSLAADDPRLESVYQHFRSNLKDILNIAAESGAKVLLSSVAVNLKDCPPFASAHGVGLSAADKGEWDKLYAAGIAAEDRHEMNQALDFYRRAEKMDGRFAELEFRIGRCLAASTNATEARTLFEKARDLDTLRFRADSRINRIIRDAAQADQRIRFLDGENLLSRASPSGSPGDEFFYEHVHLNFEGNYRLASAIAREVAEMLGEKSSQTKPFLSSTECAERLAWTSWDRCLVFGDIQRRLRQPPFSSQMEHAKRDVAWSKAVQEQQVALTPSALVAAGEVYRKALEGDEDDWVLHDRFAALLEASGDLRGAEEHSKRAVELMPHYPGAYFRLGNLCDRAGRSSEAEQWFRKVLRFRPESVEAINGLGLAYGSQGKSEDAVRQFRLALQLKPDFAGAQINWGLLLASQGKSEEAAQHYEQALRVEPDSVAAHINFGKLLVAQHRLEEGLRHYTAALELRPADPALHYNIANALTDLHRPSEAEAHYREAVRLKPDFAEAHFNLAVLLAGTGAVSAALEHFRQAALLNPSDPAGHLSYGVALARQRRFSEAAEQFRQTLQLDPKNADAKKFLQTALSYLHSQP